MRNVSVWVIFLIIIFVFMLLFSGFLGVLVKKNNSTKTWQTFSNAKYNYSLKYPASWGASTELLDDGLVLFSNPGYLKERIKNPEMFNKTDYANIDVSVYPFGVTTAGGKLESSSNIESFAKENYKDLIFPSVHIKINGNEATLIRRKNMVLKPEYEGVQNCPLTAPQTCYMQNGIVRQVWVKVPKGWLLLEDHYGHGYQDSDKLLSTLQKITNTLKIK